MKPEPCPLIAPSILSADFSRLGEEVRAVTHAGADWIHVDVMDGHFVPNMTLGPDLVAAIRRCTDLPLDVHLMIEHPHRMIPAFIQAGASGVTVHAEACVHLHRTLQQIRELGARPGVALNPATPLSVIDYVLPDLDLILIMTVNPGFGGQRSIRSAIEKAGDVKKRVVGANLERPVLIEVDGGVTIESADQFLAADVWVSGTGIFRWPEVGERRKKDEMTEAELAVSYGRVIRAFRDRASGNQSRTSETGH